MSTRPLTPQERRTVRLGLIVLGVYLVLFYGVRTWRHLETRRSDYQRLVLQAQQLKRELQPYQKKTATIQQLADRFQLDPARLSKTTVAAEASAAIQKAASSGGIQLGPIRESARGSGKELGSMQLEATGPVPAVLVFLHRLERLGYPVVFDSVQMTAEPTKPGTVKLNLTLVILDFEQWKSAEARNV
jgi:hypothetical protein